MKILSLFLIPLFLIGCSDSGDNDTGTVTGYIYGIVLSRAGIFQAKGIIEEHESEGFVPAAGVTVTLGDEEETTDSAGYFTIDAEPGTYELTASGSAYSDFTLSDVEISADEVTDLGTIYLSLPGKEWNFLVYMAADNNLETYGIADINEMEVIGSTGNVNVLVLFDRIGGYDVTNGNWTGTRLYYIKADSDTSTISSTLILDLGEADMSDPETLEEFIIYCNYNFPAEKTVLTLWNHGYGTQPRSREEPDSLRSSIQYKKSSRGICWDDTTGYSMFDCLTTDEVADALYNARLTTGKKIDIINMDACLMQMLEVAYEWHDEIDYLTGSQESVPANGNNYELVLSGLTASPLQSTKSLAEELVTNYYIIYLVTSDITYSAIDMGIPFDNLTSAFESLATALTNTSDMDGVNTAYSSVCYFDSSSFIDLYDFCSKLFDECSDNTVRVNAINVRNAIFLAVINNHITSTNPAFSGVPHGLSVYIPDYDWAAADDDDNYKLLQISADTNWDEFIDDYMDFLGF
jgi:hypothetical protein